MSFILPSSDRSKGWLSTFESASSSCSNSFWRLFSLVGNLHANLDVQIALAMPVQHRHAFVADAEGRAGLRTIGNLQRVLAFHGRHANLRAHGRLCHRDRNHAVQVVAFARKERMLLHMQHDVKISRRTAELSNFARAGESDARSVFYARRNLGVNRALAQDAPFAFALRARIGNHAARALACRTGARNAEESLLVSHLPATIARPAGGRAFAGSGSGSAAFLTSLVTANGDARLGAEECFLELERQIFAKIRAALHAAATPATTATPEHVAETKELSEDIAEILEYCGIEAGARTRTAAQSSMSVAIVGGALVRVGEHGISLADFLEFFFRVRIIGIAVRMVLQGELAISALQFYFGDCAGDAQYFVIIAFCVRGQNETFLSQTILGHAGAG